MITNASANIPVKEEVIKPEPIDISKEEQTPEPEEEEMVSPIVPTIEKRNSNKNKRYKNYSNIYQRSK